MDTMKLKLVSDLSKNVKVPVCLPFKLLPLMSAELDKPDMINYGSFIFLLERNQFLPLSASTALVTLADIGDPVRDFWFTYSQNFKVIWFSNLSTFSVPDEGYSRNASCTLNLICTFSLD
jgi:hypothetical protein